MFEYSTKAGLGTICAVWTEHHGKLLGFIGEIEDLLKRSFILDSDSPADWWMFVSQSGFEGENRVGETPTEALAKVRR